MADPVTHAELTMLIAREKELDRKVLDLDKEIPVWTRRVALAEEKGMASLADEARDHLRQLQGEMAKAKRELESIDMQKDVLHRQARRPSGREVERAENLLEQVRLAGLVDPDRLDWENLEKKSSGESSDAILDFDGE